MHMQTVGLPQALLYHRYGEFWKTWLNELGFEVKVSRATTKRTVEQGLGKVSSEVCLPIKIIAGHIEELKDSVDCMFVPRMVWMRDQLFACPKMIGIADIARLNVPRGCKVLAPTIKGSFALPHLQMGFALTRNPARALSAWRKAAGKLPAQPELPDLMRESDPRRPAVASRTVALISHFYNLGDEYVSRDITDTLKSHGMRIYTKEDLPDSILHSREGLADSVRWLYERELYNAFRFYSGSGSGRLATSSQRSATASRVDGICAVVSFGCGPDSLIVELMQQEAKLSGVPFTQLIVDEHTGKAGIVTRLEAFVDTIVRRSAN